MSSQIKKQIIAALNSDKESLLVEKLLAQSKDNFQRNFGKNGYADWIYADLEDLIRENTAPPKREWQGLTDEEIKEIIGPWGDTPIKGYTRELFDKIEAKLKEKNT
jgi:hypothetical protein